MAHIEGGCLCGKVRYTATAEPVATALCHCTHCQKHTGSAFAALFAVPPLLLLSLLLDGPHAIMTGLAHAGPLTWAAVLWQSAGNTMFGYACWAWLLSRYPAATVAPLSLLVPVFGFGSSAAILGEPMPFWKILATLLIMGGLALNLLWRPRKAASGEAA